MKFIELNDLKNIPPNIEYLLIKNLNLNVNWDDLINEISNIKLPPLKYIFIVGITSKLYFISFENLQKVINNLKIPLECKLYIKTNINDFDYLGYPRLAIYNNDVLCSYELIKNNYLLQQKYKKFMDEYNKYKLI